MNDRAREALVAAGLKGVRQIKGALYDPRGGRCAMGVIQEAGAWDVSLRRPLDGCPECGAKHQTYHASMPIRTEEDLIIHLNNDHGWDFLTIARKVDVTDGDA